MGAIFLSASVPTYPRSENFPPADPYLIQAAVRAFVLTILGRRLIVWGGHPSITPMVWTAAEDLGVSFQDAVRLYQSRHFKDDFPKINQRFGNVTLTDDVNGDLDASLLAMRMRIFNSHRFEGAVFIGGMEGVAKEFDFFRGVHKTAKIVLVASAGGATAALAREHPDLAEHTTRPFDYAGLFVKRLAIDPMEKRKPNLS